MKTFICNNCGNIESTEIFNEETKCSKCDSTFENLEIIENQIADNEIDAIIDSVLEDETNSTDNKIINKYKEDKFLYISNNNLCIKRNNDKCVNCGLCKKTCETYANLKYNLNKCDKPICIGCGECIKKCPTKAININEKYDEIKEIINKNEKIVVAIVEPNIEYIIRKKLQIDSENFELKLNDILKKIGFDYSFNSGFASDIKALEEVTEFLNRIKNKKDLPLITSNCTSMTKYIQYYHPQLINNLSTCKNPLAIQGKIIKENFCQNKGFNKEKIITVGISTCLANKYKSIDNNDDLDYVITPEELIKLIELSDLNLNNLEEKKYDDFEQFSNSSKLLDIIGGESEIFAKMICKLINKTIKETELISEEQFRNINDRKDININIGNNNIKIGIINSIYELDYLINSGKYKNYHYIEIKICKNGCIKEMDSKEIYNQIKKIKYPFNNKKVKEFYDNNYDKPFSEKAIKNLHEVLDDLSNQIK